MAHAYVCPGLLRPDHVLLYVVALFMVDVPVTETVVFDRTLLQIGQYILTVGYSTDLKWPSCSADWADSMDNCDTIKQIEIIFNDLFTTY